MEDLVGKKMLAREERGTESLRIQKRRGGLGREQKEAADEMKKLKRGVRQVLLLIIPFQVEGVCRGLKRGKINIRERDLGAEGRSRLKMT